MEKETSETFKGKIVKWPLNICSLFLSVFWGRPCLFKRKKNQLRNEPECFTED